MNQPPVVVDRPWPDAHEAHRRARLERSLMVNHVAATTWIVLWRAGIATRAALRHTLTALVARRLP